MFDFIKRLFKKLNSGEEQQIIKQASPDTFSEVEETPEQIVRRARIEYVKIAKCCFK